MSGQEKASVYGIVGEGEQGRVIAAGAVSSHITASCVDAATACTPAGT
jgi:hypothetical protein